MNATCERLGFGLGCWLSCPRPWLQGQERIEQDVLACLEPGDVLLVEGSSRLSTVIQYLTQSSWTHAALFVGNAAGRRFGGSEGDCFVEADLTEGVRLVGFDEFADYPLRICRPIGLKPAEIELLVESACQRIGHRYDLRNIVDLARYLLPLPPVPARWRRRFLTLGSGDPTRAICSTLIAQAFQAVHYPILPLPATHESHDLPRLRQRHHSLFTPRDFDLSPYFAVIKPTLIEGFDPHRVRWEPASAVSVRP